MNKQLIAKLYKNIFAIIRTVDPDEIPKLTIELSENNIALFCNGNFYSWGGDTETPYTCYREDAYTHLREAAWRCIRKFAAKNYNGIAAWKSLFWPDYPHHWILIINDRNEQIPLADAATEPEALYKALKAIQNSSLNGKASRKTPSKKKIGAKSVKDRRNN